MFAPRRYFWVAALLGLSIWTAGMASANSKPPAEDAAKPAEKEPNKARSNRYVGDWRKLVPATLPTVDGSGTMTIQPERGYVTVIYFFSSWCEACQTLVKQFTKLDRQFSESYVRFEYVFSHDTRDDARGFIKEHGITSPAGLANHEILRDYFNPPLPTIYVADKNQLLVSAYENATEASVKDLQRYLALLVSF